MPFSVLPLLAGREMVRHALSLDRKDEAQRLVQVVLGMMDETSPPSVRAAVLVSAGAMYFDMSDPDAARELFVQALDLRDDADFCVPRNIALVYIEAGEFEKAYEMIRQIKGVKDRAVPLAQLAKEVARKRVRSLP
jgi:tetratricopeptide (TPR) repeat protein